MYVTLGSTVRRTVERVGTRRTQVCGQRELFTMGSSTLVSTILGCMGSCDCVWRQVSHSGTVYLVLFVFLRPDQQPWQCVCLRVQLWDYEHVPPHPFFLYRYRYGSGPHALHGKHFANSAIHPHSCVPRMKMLWKINKWTFLIY